MVSIILRNSQEVHDNSGGTEQPLRQCSQPWSSRPSGLHVLDVSPLHHN